MEEPSGAAASGHARRFSGKTEEAEPSDGDEDGGSLEVTRPLFRKSKSQVRSPGGPALP